MRTVDAAQHRRRQPRPRTRSTGANRLFDVSTHAPEQPSGLIARPALVEGLLSASDAPLALIVAPPGYGKSALLAEWAQSDERPFVWVTPVRPASRSEANPKTRRTAEPSSDELARLIDELRREHERFVVVLDDAQLVSAPILRGVVDGALAELPAGATLAVATRTEPVLPIGRLRANRLLTEVRAPQLMMCPTEAGALLEEAGVKLEREDVKDLVRRTEGWPAALYLAALAMLESPDGTAAGVGGRHHLLTEYLRDEVFGVLPADLIEFSVQTSIVDEMSGPICDAVLERRDSARVLERLARSSPLVIPVDTAHHTYRWHQLMREALGSELRRLDPESERELRLRAGRWYSDSGDIRRAIDQTAAAGDASLTGDLLWPELLRFLTSGQNELVSEWLGNFCGDRLADSAPLTLSASLSALIEGNMNDAQHWALTATSALEQSGPEHDVGSLRTGLAIVDSISAHAGLETMGEVAIAAAEAEPEDSAWRPICSLLAAVSSYLRGDREGADLLLQESIRLSGNGLPIVTSLSLAQRAMVAIELEDWDLAAELADRAAMIVEEWGLTDERLSALVFAAAAAARARLGRIDEAKRDLRRGIDLLTALGDFVPWYGAEARMLFAHASLWLADATRARTLLAEASRFARRVQGATIFSAWFERAWAQMDTLAETSLAGPSSLTIAELRILRFLPSHRSFREIASQLGVSANTVKTQAHAVYRKLGAASRSEAVAQAIEAGLLGG